MSNAKHPVRFQSASASARSGIRFGRLTLFALLVFASLAAASNANAARIGEITQSNWQEQAIRFLTLKDSAARCALAGALLTGLSCGLLGGFVVVRKMALVGDTLSHAVLPGIALG